MNKYIFTVIIMLSFITPAFSEETLQGGIFHFFKNDTKAIKSLLKSQVRYANKTNFNKFIATYDKDYMNADGLDLEKYSNLVKDVWETYDNIEYNVEIKNIALKDNNATVEVVETSYAKIPAEAKMEGVLSSEANSIYYLKKIAFLYFRNPVSLLTNPNKASKKAF